MRFLSKGPRIDLELTRIDLRLASDDLPQTGPEMASDDLPDWSRDVPSSEQALFNVLLTIAELKHRPSKDWIRPPSQSQE